MPIVTPGKRPAPRFEKSRILGGKMVKGRKATNAELNVVPMVDMMTMLAIFLLQQFSSTGEVMYMQKDIKLPDARHGQMIEVAPVVAISSQQVVVTGVKVAEIADLDRDSGYLNIPALVAYSVLQGRTQSMVDEINETSVAVLNLIVANKDKMKMPASVAAEADE